MRTSYCGEVSDGEVSDGEVSDGEVSKEDNDSFEEECDICVGGEDVNDAHVVSSVGTGDCPFFRITTILSRDAFGRIGRSKSYTDAKNDGA